MESIIVLTIWGRDGNPMISMYLGEGTLDDFKNSPVYDKLDEIVEMAKEQYGDHMIKITITTRLRVMLPASSKDEIIWRREE